MPSSLSAWSRILQIVLELLCAFIGVVVGFAVVMIVIDERDHADSWDGVGTFFGLVLGGVAVVVLAVLVALLLVTRSGRARNHRRRLAWAAGLSALLALTFLAWMGWMLLEYVAQPSLLLPAIGLPAAALAIPAVATLVEALKTPDAATVPPFPPR